MDLRAVYVVLLVFVLFAGARVSAVTHHYVPESDVGDWVVGRVFRVGDKLWFKSSGEKAAVVEVRGPEEFEKCDLSNPIRMYTDENVALDEEGVRYFVSGSLEHCKNGLKLPVAVESESGLTDPFNPPEPFTPTPGFGPFDPVKPDFAPPQPFGPFGPFEPVKPDLPPPQPFWPSPSAFPPEPPFGPYEPPLTPLFPPPSRPSGASGVKANAAVMILGLLFGYVVMSFESCLLY